MRSLSLCDSVCASLSLSLRCAGVPHPMLRRMSSAVSSVVTSRAASTAPAASGAAAHPVASAIRAKLTAALAPVHFLDIVNESFKHNVPKGSESHFKVTVVSPVFDGKKLLARHRLVNAALADELSGPVHALSISAKTPDQWEKHAKVHETPNCLGGSKR